MKNNWLLAYVWWLIWGFGRWVWYADGDTRPSAYWRAGRDRSWYPIRCACGWRGAERWCRHGYKDYGGLDLTPMDFCPNCGEELG